MEVTLEKTLFLCEYVKSPGGDVSTSDTSAMSNSCLKELTSTEQNRSEQNRTELITGVSQCQGFFCGWQVRLNSNVIS